MSLSGEDFLVRRENLPRFGVKRCHFECQPLSLVKVRT